MEENIFNTIRHEYKIENCIIEKRNDSTDGNVYTIFDNQNKFIAKIYKQEEHTKSMINLHLFLIKNGFIVPNIVKNIKLMDNIDLRGHESEYYKVFEKEIKVDKNNYHITM